MTLGKKQELFMRLLPLLIIRAHQLGYELRGGDLFRDPRTFGPQGVKVGYSKASSAHKNKLAIDLNLFKDGEYLDATDNHYALGKFWESLHPLTVWGGNWEDGNHYSISHQEIS